MRSGIGGDDEDYVILSTIHSAKGQEWSAVSVLRVVDGCLPSDMATGNSAEIEEERRLLYVAMTRARHHLHLLVPQRFYVTQQAASWRPPRLRRDQPVPAAGRARSVRARSRRPSLRHPQRCTPIPPGTIADRVPTWPPG